MKVYWITVAAVNCTGYLIKHAMDKNAFIAWSCTYMPELNMSMSVCVMRAFVSKFSFVVLDLCFCLYREVKRSSVSQWIWKTDDYLTFLTSCELARYLKY